MGGLEVHQIVTATLILMAGVSVVERLAPGYAYPFVLLILLALLIGGNARNLGKKGSSNGQASSFATALADLLKTALKS